MSPEWTGTDRHYLDPQPTDTEGLGFAKRLSYRGGVPRYPGQNEKGLVAGRQPATRVARPNDHREPGRCWTRSPTPSATATRTAPRSCAPTACSNRPERTSPRPRPTTPATTPDRSSPAVRPPPFASPLAPAAQYPRFSEERRHLLPAPPAPAAEVTGSPRCRRRGFPCRPGSPGCRPRPAAGGLSRRPQSRRRRPPFAGRAVRRVGGRGLWCRG